jgi:hypothetical protein
MSWPLQLGSTCVWQWIRVIRWRIVVDSGGEAAEWWLSYLRNDGGLFLFCEVSLALNPKTNPMYTKNGHCTSSMTDSTIYHVGSKHHRRLHPRGSGSRLAALSRSHRFVHRTRRHRRGAANTSCQTRRRPGDPGNLAIAGWQGGSMSGQRAGACREG